MKRDTVLLLSMGVFMLGAIIGTFLERNIWYKPNNPKTETTYFLKGIDSIQINQTSITYFLNGDATTIFYSKPLPHVHAKKP